MSTKTAKAQATATRTQSKRATTTARTQARGTGEAAQRTVKTVVTDAGYATVGLSDTAIAFARTLPTKLQSWQVEAPRLAQDTPKRVEERFSSLRRNAEREFDVLAERGRNIVNELSKSSSAAQRAAEQARVARQQLNAATTSLRRAVFSGAEAVEDTVESAGRQAEREQYEAMTLAELQDIARRKGVENRSEKNKKQLINALLSA